MAKKKNNLIKIDASFEQLVKESVSGNPVPNKKPISFKVKIDGQELTFSKVGDNYFILKDGAPLYPVTKNKEGNWEVFSQPEFRSMNEDINRIINDYEKRLKKAEG